MLFVDPLSLIASIAFALLVSISDGLMEVGNSDQSVCGNPANIEKVKEAFANGPLTKTLNFQILDVTEMQQVAKSETETSCEAKALLNSGAEVQIEYRFFIRNNRPFVGVHVK